MANLNFKYGANWAALKTKPVVNGTIYITKEEKAMYVDLDGARHRLGQIIDFQTWDDFNSSTTTPPQHPDAYYYIIDQNALLRYDSVNEKWNQINSTSTLAADLTTLKSKISELETRATNLETKDKELAAADEANSVAIKTEKERAETAETALQTAINDEAATARAAEQKNADSISGLSTRVNNFEKTYATAADVNDQISNLQDQITSNDTDIATLQDDLNNASTGLKAKLTTVDGRVAANADNISKLDTKVTNIENSYVKTTTFNDKIADLESDIADNASGIADLNAALDTVGTGIKARLTAVEDKATTNADDISGLKTLTGTHTNDIAGLKAADKTNSDAITAEKARAEAAESALETAIDNEATIARAAEKKNADDIAGNKISIGNNANKINENTTSINNLKALVGSIPEDSNADTVVDFVIEQMEAADAMTYQGGISQWTELPTTGVEAGFTYVIIGDFVHSGESYYAGDLVIANLDQTGASYTGGWTHVKTGYVASQENKLVKGDGNNVILKSYTGTDLGSMTIASDNLTISTSTTSANATTVQIDFAWGTF